uniref:ACBP superfamily protein n=1 Tax=Tremella fuciformis TaxID=64657 RepID=D5KY11_9TREE|nr:ACBP superfamily protein [Tremella fuciformis]
MSVQAKFEAAVAIVGELPKDGPVQPTSDDRLAFYSYYKQAKEGDCNAPAPGMFDFVAKAKYKAWKALEGLSKEDAMKKYVELLEAMLQKADDEQSKESLKKLQEAGAGEAAPAATA